MGTDLSMKCTYQGCPARYARRGKTTFLARATTFAVALAALLVMAYGEDWLLQESPAASSEFTVATCAIGDFYGDVQPASVCTRTPSPTN